MNEKFNALFFRLCENVPMLGYSAVKMDASKCVATKIPLQAQRLVRIKMKKVPTGSNENVALSPREVSSSF